MNIKKRAERNAKIRRIISKIEQTIAKLERTKDEYIERAVAAKQSGENKSYAIAKRALNITLSQIKRAKEMLLNIQITSELQQMAELNSDFLSTMSTMAKSISKVNSKSNFVKLQKDINDALSGAVEARDGLDTFLESADAAFSTIAESQEELSDDAIDQLISGGMSERELLMDEEIERMTEALRERGEGNVPVQPNDRPPVTPPSPPPVPPFVPVEPAPPTPFVPTEPKAPDMPTPPPQTGSAAPVFPQPSGTMDFSAKTSRALSSDIVSGKLPIKIGASEPIADVNGKALPRCTAVYGKANARRQYFLRLITTQLTSLSAKTVRIVAVDLDGLGLSSFNGAAHLSCNVLESAEGLFAALDELAAEATRREQMLAKVGARDIYTYIGKSGEMPFIVVVLDGYNKVYAERLTEKYNEIANKSDVGIRFVFGSADRDTTYTAVAVEANGGEPRIDEGAVTALVKALDGSMI